MPLGSGPPPRFVVCGDDPLAYRLVDELTSRYRAQVTVILPSRRRNYGPKIDALPGVTTKESDRLDVDVFREARLTRASGLALVRQDDVGNIRAALIAQELHPELRLVIRMFNMSLGYGIRRLFRDCAVLSDAAMAAPEFVAAALGEVAPHFVRVAGRTLYVARSSDVDLSDVVCGVAVAGAGGHLEVLPADDRDAELVLAMANRRHRPARPMEPTDHLTDVDVDQASPLPGQSPGQARRQHRILALSRALLSLIDRKLEVAALVMVLIFLAGVLAVGVSDHVTPWQAFYTTLLIAVGGGDPSLQLSPLRQAIQVLVALAGIALVPVLTAIIVDAIVNARLAVVLGRLRTPMSGHLVVIGLGNVGTRVIRTLHELGHDVVAIDSSGSARGAQLANELDIPLIVGDASQEETLQQASVHTCRALLALTTDDIANLEAALHARTMRPGLRVVLRLFDDDFARRVEEAFDIPISRSVSQLAAPAFAAALLERDVIGTIAVDRRVLTIAELPVGQDSILDGRTIADAADIGSVRVVAHTVGMARPGWKPDPETRVRAGDQLLVIANQVGLSQLLARIEPAGSNR